MNQFVEGCRDGALRVGKNVALVVNTLLLVPVYFLGIGTSSLLVKLARKDPLGNRGEDSYWNDLALGKRPMEEYHRQF